MTLKPNGLIQFENYVIDPSHWRLRWQDESIAINRKTFDLLLLLVEHRDRVLSKEELMQSLWPGQFVEESNLTQHIFLLRKALSRHESGTRIIETVPGRGYRFAAPVITEPKAEQPETVRNQIVVTASESITEITIEEDDVLPYPDEIADAKKRRRKKVATLSVLAGSLTAALLVAGWFAWQRWLDRTGGPPVDVVLAATDGTTGDPVLDATLVEAFRIDLAQSPFVSLVPGATVRATLTQMMHKSDDPLTPDLAREVCERNNSQAVIHGAIARSGQHFLLTEEVSNCVDGKTLAGVKHEAVNAEDLPHSIDVLTESIRQKLGESRRSISRFSTPLFHVNTASLEALKTFTQGTQQFRAGRLSSAISLFKTSIASDPQFASAYYNMAAAYTVAGNDSEARTALEKAYALKDSAAKPSQFAIIGLYSERVTGDLYEGLRNAENWVALYPNSSTSWSGLSYAQRSLGHRKEALEASKRSIELMPHSQGGLSNLAMDQLQSGDLKGARATCDRAIADHLDGDRLRARYLEVAYLLHDRELLLEQISWARTHPDAVFLLEDEASFAIAEGRFSDAHKLMAQVSAMKRQQGLSDTDDEDAKQQALDLMRAGDMEEGKKIFKHTPIHPNDGGEMVGLIYSGDIPGARAALRTMQAKFPNGTMWNLYWGPQIEATIAIQEHRPKDAAAILEKASSLETIGLAIPWLRGEAYLAAGQPDLAEKSFRMVITHPEFDAASPGVPLSRLGLARAFAAKGDRTDAIDAYRHFLALWTHADPDALYLRQAKQELAALETAPAVK